MKSKQVVTDQDVGLWHAVIPPAIVPISDRAKAHMGLPWNCDGVLLMDTPEDVLASFPEDYTFAEIREDDWPSCLVVGSAVFISDLH